MCCQAAAQLQIETFTEDHMNVLFDIVDTAHVHFFKSIIQRLQQEGHSVIVTARQKDITIELLKKLDIDYISISKCGSGLFGLAWELVVRYFRMFGVVRKFKPDVMLAKNGGASIGLIGALFGVPRLVLEDTEHAKLQRAMGLPFATRIITGTGYLYDHGKKQRRFNGVWVQSFLNADFTPDPVRLQECGIDTEKPYIVVRTVAWEAAHDIGYKGISLEKLREIVEKLGRFGRVLLCSETQLPPDLQEYRNPAPSEDVHHLLALASLYIGEGASMAAEAAVLGTPAVYYNPLGLGYLQAMEKEYGLVKNAASLDDAIIIAENLLKKADLAEEWERNKEKFLADSDDLVDVMLDEIKTQATKKQRPDQG